MQVLNESEHKLVTEHQNGQLQRKTLQLKRDLELQEIKQAQGAQVRCRAKWTEDGEKNTKYFLRLEKHRSATNIIFSLKIGDLYTDNHTEILDKIKRFYENLYKQTKPANVNWKMKTHFLSDEIYPTLTDDEGAESDKETTVTELTHALSLLNKDSAPSSFYTHLWGKKLQIPFLKCILQSTEKGEFPFT